MVTGASRGFGRALSDALEAAGWRVTAICRSDDSSRPSRATIVGDVRDPETSRALAERIADAPLELVVNNAGILGGSPLLASVDVADVEATFATSVIGPLQIVRAVRTNLAAADGALIVNVGSRLASLSRQAADHYGQASLGTSYGNRIAKAAQNMLGIALAQELASERIAVWAVHPGRLTTRMGSAAADTTPEDAARRAVELVTARDRDDLRTRFISLDLRETTGGHDIPW